MRKILFFMTSVMTISTVAVAETPNIDELYQTVQKQQAQIEALQSSSAQQQERLNLAADAIEHDSGSHSATNIGGYAELHYNSLNNEGDSGRIDDVNQIDLHRFVLFVSHQYNSKTRFFSEFEIEHSIAGDGKKGEVEVEQAFIEYDFTDTQHMKVGLFLIPVGLMNETHEPNTFYGVERNSVEKNIIPATWWEGGLAFGGDIGAGFSYDVALTSGLSIDTAAGKYKIRDGRQKVSEAKSDDLATTLRFKYTGMQGLEIGLAGQHQSDITQSETDDGIEANLFEVHLAYQIQGFGLRALYASWDIDDKINNIKSGAAEQSGWYIEPSYKFDDHWGIFIRASEWDNQADDNADSAIAQYDVGLNYWMNEYVAIKFDFQDQDPESEGAQELDGFNLGVGLSF